MKSVKTYRLSICHKLFFNNTTSWSLAKNDPRLIVNEPKHPMTKPLEDQRKDATKEWIIFQLTQAITMIDIVNKSNIVKTRVFLKKEKV